MKSLIFKQVNNESQWSTDPLIKVSPSLPGLQRNAGLSVGASTLCAILIMSRDSFIFDVDLICHIDNAEFSFTPSLIYGGT